MSEVARFCQQCGQALAPITLDEDSGAKTLSLIHI